MLPVPSMNTGTTGAPVRLERYAAPPLNSWPQPSGERPPSGKITRLQPSSIRWRSSSLLLRLVTSRSIGNAFSASAARLPFIRLSKK
jgi:hypothetical protein